MAWRTNGPGRLSKSLSALQQDILLAAQANGGSLTYKEAYKLFFSRFRVAWRHDVARYRDHVQQFLKILEQAA